MITKTIDNFSLSQICQSGQCFRMNQPADGDFIILAGDRYLKARQQGSECSFDCAEAEFEGFWKPYFDLEQGLFAFHQLEAFPVDTHIGQALEKHYKRGFPKRRYQDVQGVM